ncbi:alpha-ketoacid dehydrogenase subunit alpha/beta [Prauserella muralis]|uniref:dihydrolipoyllysine-residue succinyltransferase n=1 Tax=Prauserella muralis TaxID=588067 RepID=A0A2V4B5U1_9PSEU|nr:pyruvate dehydrogenase complex E1 component subunit beta [Prauserella muralis]PXY28445.1 2-oxoisovalerate dehydrogenase [Prauserella muralis]
MNRAQLLDAYQRMVLIRLLEERISVLYRDGKIPGFVHTSVGQEACAVGALFHTRRADVITSTHRGHGHVLAKGLEPRRVLAELMARETGACRGRGGSMHVADPSLGIYGANGIVGAGLPIAVGAAQAFAARGQDGVVVAFFGDGAVATGAFHESLNLAALRNLPVVFFCENNRFSEFSRAADQHPVPISARALAYGVPFVELEGNDVGAVADGMADVLEKVRSGGGPCLVEGLTLRVRGHYEGDQQAYRTEEELAGLAAGDPLTVARDRLLALGAGTAEVEQAENAARQAVADAEAFAHASPHPEAASAGDDVYAPRRRVAPVPAPERPGERPSSVSRILRQALRDALTADERVFLAGIDVAGGNVFGITRGLAEDFPGRVLDTPISETAIMGMGVGAAMSGLRPVVELMYFDFLGVCFDQLLNQAAKLRFMTGGAVTVPLVVRTQFGSGRSSGSQHSQSLEALLAHVPGLTVVMPSSGPDAYGLLRSSIEDDNPVVFVENRLLYEKKFTMPPESHRVPLGQARIVRPGTDVTLVSWSRMVHDALDAARTLHGEGIDAEVVDLRTIVPLDRETVLASLRRTNRLVIAQEAVVDFGVGAELSALAAREGFWSLDAPVARVGAAYSPAPYAPGLERQWRAGPADIVRTVRDVVSC